MNKLKDKIENILQYFEEKDGRVLLKLETPDDVYHLVRKCHQGMLPDDTRHHMIYEALKYIASYGDDGNFHDIKDEFIDWYISDYYFKTQQLLDWLNSHAYRISYFDDALREYRPQSFEEACSYAIGLELSEVWGELVEYLEQTEA